MPRNARIVVPGAAHHVTQRGIRRSPIFYDSEDRDSYTEVIGRNCEKFGVGILAWCWMTNHVHLVAVPEHANSLALALRRAHSIYARRFNAKYHFSGYLWQNRYYSCPLDESHTFAAIRYVEQNPVRANMVVLAEDYPWSSARAHSRGCADVLLSVDWTLPPMEASWSSWLAGQDDRETTRLIRANTTKGYPVGTEEFISQLESDFGRPLRPRPPGPQPGHSGKLAIQSRRS